MLKYIRGNDVHKYETQTAKLTIINCTECKDDDDDDDGIFESNKQIIIKFEIDKDCFFSQKMEVSDEKDSVFNQIYEVLGLSIAQEPINPSMLIGKEIDAVIATKSDWKKAFIVAAFN